MPRKWKGHSRSSSQLLENEFWTAKSISWSGIARLEHCEDHNSGILICPEFSELIGSELGRVPPARKAHAHEGRGGEEHDVHAL